MPFWPFLFESKALKSNPNLKIDWDKWVDEDTANQELEGVDNFDPNDPEQMEKMMEMMKKNGDWDEEDNQREIEEMKLAEE